MKEKSNFNLNAKDFFKHCKSIGELGTWEEIYNYHISIDPNNWVGSMKVLNNMKKTAVKNLKLIENIKLNKI